MNGRLYLIAVAALTASCHLLPALDLPPERASAWPSEGDAGVSEGAASVARVEAPTTVERPARWWQRLSRPAFELDGWSRYAERDTRGRLVCPDVELGVYRGTTLKYHKALRVNPWFEAQLARFEEVARDVAIEVYGRPPSKVVHYGTYNCRTIRKRKHKLSEHALGNAIDIAGFEFATLPRKERKALAGSPSPFSAKVGRRFRVDVLKHWDAETGFAAQHARFLKRLVIELRRDDVFRGMIVPPAPGHHNHLHLDMGRWGYLRGDVTLPPPERVVGAPGTRS